MSAVEVAVRFAVAWLVVGLGLFLASGSLRAMLPAHGPAVRAGSRAPGIVRALYLIPILAGLGLVIAGLAEFVRVVPW